MKQRVIYEIIFAKQLPFLSLRNYWEQELTFHWEVWHAVLVSYTVSFLSLAGEINDKTEGAGGQWLNLHQPPLLQQHQYLQKLKNVLNSFASFWNSVDRVFPIVVFKVGVKFDSNKCFSAANLAAFISIGLLVNLSL